MNRREAREALSSGKRVSHKNFTADEWVENSDNDHKYIFEDGVKQFKAEFWSMRGSSSWTDGWRII